MPGPDIFPAKDAEFNNYIGTAIPYLVTNKTRLGISDDNSLTLETSLNEWGKIWMDFTDPAKHTSVVTATKTQQRHKLEDALRNVYGDLPHSQLTIQDRQVLNLKEREHGSRVPAATTAPVITVEGTTHLQHTLRFQNPGNPNSNALPHGQQIILAWFTGAAALPVAEIVFNNFNTVNRALTNIQFTEAQAGQTCYYRCCYENRHDERGPWSNVAEVIVG